MFTLRPLESSRKVLRKDFVCYLSDAEAQMSRSALLVPRGKFIAVELRYQDFPSSCCQVQWSWPRLSNAKIFGTRTTELSRVTNLRRPAEGS